MPLLRPIQRDGYIRSSSDIEQLKLFAVTTGSYLDNPTPAYPRTQLGRITAGTRVGGRVTRINGGVL